MKILLTGARSMATLDLARHLKYAGHQVIVADTDRAPISRFSKAVALSCQIPSPRFQTESFNRALIDLVKKHSIDLLIPTWEETLYVSRILDYFPTSCEVFCSSFEKVHRLHNKFQFITLLQGIGIETPKTRMLSSNEELKNRIFDRPFALKACYCRGSEALYKVNPWDPIPDIDIPKDNPWIAQEWIEGKRYSTYTVCKEGQVLAHTTYPIEFTRSGKFAVTFEAHDHPGILNWTKQLVAAEQYTGQIAFDFIETDSKALYAIECNPRITSGVHLFRKKDGLERAFTEKLSAPIIPSAGTRQQIIPGMLMYGWRGITSFKEGISYLKRLCSVRDTIVRLDDPLPLLMTPFLFSGYWITAKRLGLSMPATFSYDLEWNHEAHPPSKERLA